jgi:uncharacterized repeat protein (TIGR03803 family)
LGVDWIYGVCSQCGSNGFGVVYRVDSIGSNYMVLHHFSLSPDDGTTPAGGVQLIGRDLYGTTAGGGSNYNGTVWKLNIDTGEFRVIGNFDGSTTGGEPQGDLTVSAPGDTLYGVTYAGGTNGGGTVYSINTNGGNFAVLHSFTTPTADSNGGYTNIDGGWPVSGLQLETNRYALFGTTPYGGTNGVGVAYMIRLPAPPRLRITNQGTNAVKITWPSWATNYVLLENSSLAGAKWTTNSLPVFDNGTNRSITITPLTTNDFFRLVSTNAP